MCRQSREEATINICQGINFPDRGGVGEDELGLFSAHGSREHMKALRPLPFAYLLAQLHPLVLNVRKALARSDREGIKLCRLQTIAVSMAYRHPVPQDVAHAPLGAQQRGE